MKVFEITAQENILLKGLGAAKSAIAKAIPGSTKAATASDDAVRAAQDARAMSIGQRGISLIPKAGQRVRLDVTNAGKDPRFAIFVSKDKGMNLSNYVDGKVVDVVQSGPAGQMLKVKLDSTGEIVSWPAERFVSVR